jgi:ABC-type lipoprotein export system ATPase subunit
MISFQNVTKSYRLDEETTITPVKDVTLSVDNGEFIVITGRSGSGKTTLLNLAAGLVKPSSGKVLMDEFNLGEMKDKQISSLRSQSLGFVFQFPSLLPSLSVLDNVALPHIFISHNGHSDARQRAAELLKTVGLSTKLDVLPKQLSAGEQKRVVIARSLMNQPKMILADEPTSDLDEKTENEVMGLLRDINHQGVTFMIVTHNLSLISFSTRAFEMLNGSLRSVS